MRTYKTQIGEAVVKVRRVVNFGWEVDEDAPCCECGSDNLRLCISGWSGQPSAIHCKGCGADYHLEEDIDC